MAVRPQAAAAFQTSLTIQDYPGCWAMSPNTEASTLSPSPLSPVVPSSSELRQPDSLWTASCQQMHCPVKPVCAPALPAYIFFLQSAPHLWGPHTSAQFCGSGWFYKPLSFHICCSSSSLYSLLLINGGVSPCAEPHPQLSVHTSQSSQSTASAHMAVLPLHCRPLKSTHRSLHFYHQRLGCVGNWGSTEDSP